MLPDKLPPKKAPAGPAQAQAQQTMDATAADREAALSQEIPDAEEPLDPSNINALADTVKSTIEAVTGGQITADEIQIAEVTEPQDRVPADLGKHVLALCSLVNEYVDQEPALKPYQCDATDEMKDNDGLTELASVFDGLAHDKKALRVFELAGKAEKAGKPEKSEQPAADNLEQE